MRTPFVSKVFTYVDGPQFAIAIEHFSIRDHFPAPPGHFLYVMAAKLINYFSRDPRAAFSFLSVLFTGLNSVALFLIGKRIFDFKVGLISSLIYMTSPLTWFYSITCFVYPVNGFFALMSGFFLYKVIYKNQDINLIWAALFYALMIGIRPPEFIFILPLWIWAWFKARSKVRILSLLVLSSICFAWFIPLAMMSGGIKEYTYFIFKEVSLGQTRFSDSIFTVPGLLKANLKHHIFVYIITFGLGVIPFFYYLPQFFNLKSILSDKKAQIFLCWIVPSLLFWAVFNFNNAGYIIVALLPLIILLSEFLNRIAQELKENLALKLGFLNKKNLVLSSFMFLFIIPNTIYYFYDFNPQDKGNDHIYAFQTYPEIKKRNLQLNGKFGYIKENISPQDSIVITTSLYFIQVMYHLPEYHVYSLSGIAKRGSNAITYGYLHKRKNLYNFDVSSIFEKNNIKKVVLFEDYFRQWDKSTVKKEIITIADRYQLIIIYPQLKDRLKYGLSFISIEKE